MCYIIHLPAGGETPGPPPAGIARERLWHGVIARSAPRVAAEKTGCPDHAADPQSMPGDGLVHIGGAGRQMSALSPDEGRQRVLIDTNHHMRRGAAETGQNIHHVRLRPDVVELPHNPLPLHNGFLPLAGLIGDLLPASASICSTHSTVASKVRRVEACRAL